MPPKNLTQAATEVINLFNAPPNNFNYNDLLKKMDHRVALERVLHPDLVSGIGNVHGYLNLHMFDRNPKLLNAATIGPPFPPPYPPYTDLLTQIPAVAAEVNAKHGQVTGTGKYVDDNGQSGGLITFTLSFVRESVNEEWSLFSSSATLM